MYAHTIELVFSLLLCFIIAKCSSSHKICKRNKLVYQRTIIYFISLISRISLYIISLDAKKDNNNDHISKRIITDFINFTNSKRMSLKKKIWTFSRPMLQFKATLSKLNLKLPLIHRVFHHHHLHHPNNHLFPTCFLTQRDTHRYIIPSRLTNWNSRNAQEAGRNIEEKLLP